MTGQGICLKRVRALILQYQDDLRSELAQAKKDIGKTPLEMDINLGIDYAVNGIDEGWYDENGDYTDDLS
jgi:hypothetical protein